MACRSSIAWQLAINEPPSWRWRLRAESCQERKSGRLRSPSATQQTACGRSRAEQVTGNPWIFSGPTLPTPGVPAFQGEHNVEILSEANVPDQVIKELQRRHILLGGP
jgi:hypothetical protein